ncbi:MAG TPA: FlgD immunoglobulin-like domain containing protein [bacterium]|nr:FlgD immunoglobulin-like domain containing protein [bacterium]
MVEGNVTRVPGQGNSAAPAVYRLAQNYPNPFNPETRITFSIPQDSRVQLAVYDLLGNPVRTLISAKMAAGEHQVIWDGRDDSGRMASSGIYFYILESKDARMMRKMTLLK